MRKVFTFFATVLLTATLWAQSPEKMSYQAVVRDAANKLVINQAIGMQISILQGSVSGTEVYIETHSPTSNANGLVSVEIGSGTIVSGDFASIDWANGPYFIKTETDPTGGTNYTIIGTNQLVSVPYALHTKTAETVTNETDPLFVASPANGITSGDIINWNNKLDVEQDSSVTNEIQALSISNDTVYLSNGGFVKLPAGFDGQYSNLTGVPTNVSTFANDVGYLTYEKDSSVINEIQALSISNDTVFLSNGGFVKLPAGFDGQYSSLTGKPTNVSTFANDAGYLTSEKDSSVINEIQALSISNDTVFLSNGGFVKLPADFDGQYSSLTGKPTNVSTFANDAGYLTSEKDSSLTNELQALSISNDTVFLSNGGFVILPAGFDGQYNSLTGKPTNVSTFANDAGYLTYEKDSSVTNEIQALSISNDTVYLSNGGFVKLPDLVKNATIVNDSLYMSFSHGQLVNIGYVGNGSPGSSLPTVTTTGISDTNYYSAMVNATITDNGNELILVRGICLSKNPNPELKDTLYINGSGQGSFITNCNELSPNTTYYVRAFATNTIGTSYGNNLSFVTKTLTIPTVTTQSVSNITNTSAISGGNISENGGLPILQRGICWALHATPTIADSVRTQGTDTGSYVALMTGLTGGTIYYVRAFATNAQGTAYGSEVSFSTVIYSLASIVTSSASNISFTTATGGGTISNDNGSPVTSRGLCWATTTNPTTADSKYTEAGALGSFTTTISGLTPNTTYYLRAFAVNGGGTSYGNQISFTTLPTSTPVLTTKSITGISSNNAGSGGNITSDGGSAITAKGVCWSLNPTPTIANSKTTDGTGTASYNSNIIGLNALTTYYVRAYATNTSGTSYGNEVSFTTTNLVSGSPTAPIVGTSTAAMLTGSTASGGGYISSDGGAAIIVRGLCWGTTANPTLANAFSTDSTTATGYFTDSITGLSGCGTIYYIRAYATNSIGTAYGNQVSVTTGGFRAITTDSVTNVSYYTAVSGGNIIDSGGCPVTARGVCWSYSANPTTGNWHTTDGTGAGTFVSTLTGLFANQTYYVRAYVTTSTGTTYGPERVFTTATPATPYIGQNYAGGIIFYLDSSGQHGLVCAPSDQGLAAWGCQGILVGATGSTIGTGAANTAAIVASCNTNGAAAYRCDTLTLNGYNDWFLPSINELSLMYTNLRTRGLGGFSSTNYPYYYYWSSTERDPNNAYDGYFPNGTFYNADTKTWNINVRAVRAF